MEGGDRDIRRYRRRRRRRSRRRRYMKNRAMKLIEIVGRLQIWRRVGERRI